MINLLHQSCTGPGNSIQTNSPESLSADAEVVAKVIYSCVQEHWVGAGLRREFLSGRLFGTCRNGEMGAFVFCFLK